MAATGSAAAASGCPASQPSSRPTTGRFRVPSAGTKRIARTALSMASATRTDAAGCVKTPQHAVKPVIGLPRNATAS